MSTLTRQEPTPPTSEPPAAAPPGAPARASSAGGARRLLRGRAGDPTWERPALIGLLVATLGSYLVNLGANGWSNAFYSAAVQAGTQSWKAFLFGSLDAGNSITVDKPPGALWVMELSARVFGVSTWSLLVPEVLMGVATVWLLHATVRRRCSAPAALLSGAALALTPVAALMFRFNNPDALLVMLLVGAAYATVRATETDRGARWMLLVGTLVGAGFLTKMMQALLVVPVFTVVYLVAAPVTVRRRLLHLLGAGAALVVSAGWWVALVELWPAGSRPYIGGSQSNSIVELILGYNGFGRLTGDETGSVGGGGTAAGGSMWGETGLARLFTGEFGGQIAWLMPAAIFFAAVLLWTTRRLPRTDGRRVQLLLWGGWLAVTGLTFSFMAGIFHTYYTVALAPAIAALVGIGATALWQRRDLLHARVALAVAVAGTGAWSWVLLARSSDFVPWLRVVVLVASLAAAAGIVVAPRLARRAAVAVVLAALVAGLAGPAAYATQTVATAHTGSLPTAGPTVAGSGPGGTGGPGGARGQGRPGGTGQGAPGQGGVPFAGAPGAGGTAGGPTTGTGGPGTAARGTAGGFGGGGGLGSLLSAGTPDAALVDLITAGSDGYTWPAATVGSNSAAGVQLATDEPVMAIGGFNGTDPSPTLAQFQQWVAQGRVHYFLASSGGGGRGGGAMGSSSGTASQIDAWVTQTFSSSTVGGVTVYDLTAATG